MNVLWKILIYPLLLFPFCANDYVPIQTSTGASKPIPGTVFSNYTFFLSMKINATKPHVNSEQKLKNKKNPKKPDLLLLLLILVVNIW